MVSSTRRTFLAGAVAASSLHAAGAAKTPVRIISTPGRGIQPQVAVSDGVVHMVFFAGDPKYGDVFYTRSEDSGHGFSSPVRVNNQGGSAMAIGAIRGAQISVGSRHRVHVAWNGSDKAEPRGPINPALGKPSSPMLYARLNDRGSTFEPQRNLIKETFGLDGGGTVAADRSGNVYAGWHGKIPGAREGEAGRQIWIARSRDEGMTFAKEYAASPEPTGACGCCAMRMFADSRGVIYGLYRSATDNVHRDIYLLRSQDKGDRFSTALLHPWNINACPMSSMSLVQAGDEVLGAWETQTQVYFAPVGRGADVAKAGIVAPPGDNPKRKYPALAGNRRGETLVAWVEGAGWQRAGVLGWQVFDAAGKVLAACDVPRPVPVWSFPAVFVRPDEGFTIVV